MLANYLSNALKYSPKERLVRFSTQEVDIGGQAWARVEVRDGGPGLSADEQVRVWERFYRAPDIKAQSGTGGGLGLGLYISREIRSATAGEWASIVPQMRARHSGLCCQRLAGQRSDTDGCRSGYGREYSRLTCKTLQEVGVE